MDKHQRVIQLALQLRDELPDLLGAEALAADALLTAAIAVGIAAPSPASTQAIIEVLDRYPVLRRRFDELVRGPLRSVALAPAAITKSSAASGFDTDSGCALVEVLFATDRQDSAQADPEQAFGGARSSTAALSLGVCQLSVPTVAGRRRGELDAGGLLNLFKGRDSRRSVLLLTLERLAEVAFAARLAAAMDPAASQGLVFIHGYNVSFHDAIRRTAQLKYDIGLPGPAVSFSWPSRGEFFSYAEDGDSAQWAAPHLAEFLLRLHQMQPGLILQLVAHSMGNRVMSEALKLLALRGVQTRTWIREIVLAAPDIDQDVFAQLAEVIRHAGERATLYASSQDRALWASGLVHRKPRAGDAGADLVVRPGIETIDASRTDSSLLSIRHSYFASRLSVLTDLAALLLHHSAPSARGGLIPVTPGGYWIMQP